MDNAKDLLSKRKEKAGGLKADGINLFPNGFVIDHTIGEIGKHIQTLPEDQQEDATFFTVAGRMMAINRFGKSAFIRFKDRTGLMQAYIRKDKVGDAPYALFKRLRCRRFRKNIRQSFSDQNRRMDPAGRNRRSGVQVYPAAARKISRPQRSGKTLSPALHRPDHESGRPGDFHQTQPDHPIHARFFLSRDFLEVETPMMQPIPGGAEATPFVTHHNALDMDLFLRIAPELYLKRLVVGGLERVFEINRNFRNEGVSTRHNPEFTMVEFYQAYATYDDLMDMTEQMFAHIAEEVNGSTSITYQGDHIELGGKWQRISLFDALERIGGVDPSLLTDKERLLDFAAAQGITVTKTGRLAKIITKLFDILVEPKLIQPTFITGYPAEVSPLSRRSDTHPDLTERFELFIAGREIANGFSELNDP
jgi:lysyl-tRNA synthetase class 2